VLSSLSPVEAHRRNVLTAFDALERLPDQREPAFVFAHVLAPHPPFVFDRNGNLPPQRSGGFTFFDAQRDLGSGYSRTYYAEQVRYLNGRVLAAVDAILARAPIHDRPIIVIQGDHGPSTCFTEADAQFKYRERMSILNAYYIPPGVTCELYDTITPVNTFRVISDGVFGTRLGRLPDVSRYSPYESPFDFVEIDPTGRPVAGAPPDTTVLDQ
jgi:hypothetical protein